MTSLIRQPAYEKFSAERAAQMQEALKLPGDVIMGTKEWFNRAVPVPTEKSKNVQFGVHFEEVAEMLDTVEATDAVGQTLVTDACSALKVLATALKTGVVTFKVTDRKELFDALLDQIVTATGCAHMQDMHVVAGLLHVNLSNFSKFDDEGCPIFDSNGKIAKGPNYYKPDLEGLY